jgi:hypothetical protein
MITRYLILAVAILSFFLGIGFYHLFLRTECPSLGTETEVVTETKIEWIKKDTTIVNLITREIPYQAKPRPEEDTSSAVYDSLRIYNGTNHFLYGSINWQATTGGTLKSLELNPSFKIPVINTVTTVTEKTTVDKQTPSLFATATYEQGELSPGLTYVRKNLLAGYKYNIQDQTHGFTVGLKIK